MSDQLYSVELDQKMGEYHIFISSKDKGKCKLKGTSICNKMEYDLNAVNIGLCITEKEVKAIVERYGKKICKACVSQFNKRDE